MAAAAVLVCCGLLPVHGWLSTLTRATLSYVRSSSRRRLRQRTTSCVDLQIQSKCGAAWSCPHYHTLPSDPRQLTPANAFPHQKQAAAGAWVLGGLKPPSIGRLTPRARARHNNRIKTKPATTALLLSLARSAQGGGVHIDIGIDDRSRIALVTSRSWSRSRRHHQVTGRIRSINQPWRARSESGRRLRPFRRPCPWRCRCTCRGRTSRWRASSSSSTSGRSARSASCRTRPRG